MTSAVAPLRFPHFRSLWAATIFSATGGFIQQVAGSWLMYELTGSSTWVGLMVASAFLPLLFFSIISGVLADMFNRANLMRVAQGIMASSALAMALLSQFGLMTPWLLVTLGFVLGTGASLNLPAWQSLLPELVPRDHLASAVALQAAAFNTARAIGPAVGGALVAAYGAAIGFGINAVSYLSVIAVLFYIAPNLKIRARLDTSLMSAASTGIRFARFTPAFRNLLALVALFAMTSAVVQAILPVHTVRLGGEAGAFGVMLGAMGAGALAGAVIRPRLFRSATRNTVPSTMALFGVVGIVIGLAPNVWVAGIGMFIGGIFWLLTMSTLNATAQLMAPEWIRGRAMSLYMLAWAGTIPLGSIIAGVVADQIGTAATFIIFSSGSIVLGLFAPRFQIPRIEDIESPGFTGEPGQPHTESGVEGGPVIVLNTWVIDPDEFIEFAKVMNRLRLVRLSTGAYRWRLMRNISDPNRITELFEIHSWEEHLAQHTRIDDAAAALIATARSFDRAGGPVNRHIIAIDVADNDVFERMVAEHEEMHRTDGSISLPDHSL
jgi:MFS family permease